MTTTANALLEFLMQLLRDPDAAEKFREDPDGELHRAGLDDVRTDDVDAVLPVVLDYAPMRVDTSFHRGPDTGGVWGGSGRWERQLDGGRSRDHADRGDDGSGWGGQGRDDDHSHAVTQLTHIVNNYAYTASVDDRDTTTDPSAHQNVWADGDVLQWFDNDAIVASGDRALAAGGDVDSSTDSSTHADARDSTVDVGTTDLDIEDSFDDDQPADGSDRPADVTADSSNDVSDHSADADLDLTDASSDQSTDVDLDLEDSFTQDDDGADVENVAPDDAGGSDDDGADLKDADVDVDASDSSAPDHATPITDNEIGATDLPGDVVVSDNAVGTTEIEDNLAVQDSFDDTFSDNVAGNDLGPDGSGEVPG